VLIHIAGDALNNIGVIIAGAIIWKTDSPARFYADPAVGVAIAIMILGSSVPLGSQYLEVWKVLDTDILSSQEERHYPVAKRAKRIESRRRKA
jgi:Co/Zn/Cd efflux system component